MKQILRHAETSLANDTLTSSLAVQDQAKLSHQAKSLHMGKTRLRAPAKLTEDLLHLFHLLLYIESLFEVQEPLGTFIDRQSFTHGAKVSVDCCGI